MSECALHQATESFFTPQESSYDPVSKGGLYHYIINRVFIQHGMPSESTAIHWYAIRIFHNKARAIKAQVDKDGLQSYVPMRTVEKFSNGNTSYINEPVIPSLIFIRADQGHIENIRKDPASYAGVYCYPGTSTPAVIPDREMEMFIFVTTVGNQNLEAIDISLAKGDRIRVTNGMFKGAEGYITRVHNAKRLIVAIEGIAAVATTYIPKDYVEKIVESQS